MTDIERSFIEGREVIEVDMNPQNILQNPLLNKGTGFTREERRDLGIDTFLPHACSTIQQQVKRRYVNFCGRTTHIDKYLFLTALQDRNETLFFRLVYEHAEEMLPYIYTPTVGDASLDYSYLYSRSRGIYLSYPLKDQIDKMISCIPQKCVDVIVVTDGERILGLGDVGIGGMVIPIGKLALYTLFGGIHPAHTLPIFLDVGTNNRALLDDPLYLGWKHERIGGKEYADFIDLFLHSISKRYPNVLIQWEDFSKQNAQPLLNRYKNVYCSFNDDIQGTASVVVAGILAAIKSIGADLKSQRLVVYGGGSAGIGIAELIVQAMIKQNISKEEAKSRIYILGRHGLVHTQSQDIDDMKKPFMQDANRIKAWGVSNMQSVTLMETVKHAKPTILVGTSAQTGAFTKEIITEMGRHVERPIIFPLSNPTSKSEALPKDLIEWTQGRALLATGSPFPPVEYDGKKWDIGQCNNVFVFPGLGLGVIASKARKVTDSMFLKAAEVLSQFAPILTSSGAPLFPRIKQLPTISQAIAIAVGEIALNEGLCVHPPKEIPKTVQEFIWKPNYAEIRKKPH